MPLTQSWAPGSHPLITPLRQCGRAGGPRWSASAVPETSASLLQSFLAPVPHPHPYTPLQPHQGVQPEQKPQQTVLLGKGQGRLDFSKRSFVRPTELK